MGTTLQEQLDRWDEARQADADPEFLVRMWAHCSLPRVDRGKRSHFVHTYGPFTLAMIAIGIARRPCGNLPLLLLARLCTEVVRTGKRDLVLGKSLRDFMGRLGTNGGGVPCRRLRDQLERLIGCATSLHYRGADKSVRFAGVIADKAVFSWDQDRPNMDRLSPREIRLSQPFFDSIARHPIPIDLNCLQALRRSTLGFDLYLWLTYHTFSLTPPLALTWIQVYAQHGSFAEKTNEKLTVQNSRKKCFPELTKTHLAAAELYDAAERGWLILHPTPAQISPVDRRNLRPECASYTSTSPLRFSPGDCRASSLPTSLHCPITHSGLWLPPAACLALDPLGRRKPAARTLTLALQGVCHCLAHAAMARPCTWPRFVLPANGFGRCRQSWVSGKRSQTLNA